MKIGDKIKTKVGIGYIKTIQKKADGRYLIIAEIPMRFAFIEGDDNIEVVK